MTNFRRQIYLAFAFKSEKDSLSGGQLTFLSSFFAPKDNSSCHDKGLTMKE